MGDGIGGGEVIDFYQAVGWATGSGYDIVVCFFFQFVLFSFVLSFPVFFLSD